MLIFKITKVSATIAGVFLILVFLLGAETANAAELCVPGQDGRLANNGAPSLQSAYRRPVPKRISAPATLRRGPTNDRPYLSKSDMEAVMKWIAVQVNASKAPYCYKQSTPRGVGVPLSTCPEGTEKNGLLCYPQCEEGYTGNGPVCWQSDCPEGFEDIGAFCQKPAAYGRGAGYVIWDEQKCNNENSQGCEKWGAMWYPRCQEGFKPFGANICSPICPEGLADTGTGCAKQSYGRGAGEPMECGEGLEEDAGLCYEACGENSNGVGPVCWQQCPSHLPESCGAGCTADTKICVNNTISQVMSVGQAAVSIASLGGGSAAVRNMDQMLGIAETLQGMAEEADGSIPVMLGKDGSFDVSRLTPMGGAYTGDVKRVQEMILHYAGMYSDDFETLTTPEVVDTINSEFSAGAVEQIKMEWGMRHLTATLKVNGIKAAQDLLYLVSFGDPTGLASVVEAFTKPQCDSETPFPEVTELD